MAKEIERKFLLSDDGWRQASDGGTRLRQGYLSTAPERNVRVRIKGEKAYLTVKGKTEGVTRLEFEYEVPLTDAETLLDKLCERPLIEKVRHRIEHGGRVWEIDEFGGENAGLVLAEVELEDENQTFEIPSWLGDEVSDDPRYYNASLIRAPYSTWR